MTSGSMTLKDKSTALLANIFNYYDGSAEYKIYKAENFLEKLMFSTMAETQNPFSNNGRETYDVAYYAKNVLLPNLKQQRMEMDQSDPFNIHDWN